jgi:hypothetical protein
MKTVADYLERAVNFRSLARAEKNPAAQEQLFEQGEAYHKLAVNRAKTLGQPLPPPPSSP